MILKKLKREEQLINIRILIMNTIQAVLETLYSDKYFIHHPWIRGYFCNHLNSMFRSKMILAPIKNNNMNNRYTIK